MDETIFQTIPTIAKMLPLFDAGYKPDIEETEIMKETAQTDIHIFINTLLDTKPMQLTMEFLIKKGMYHC